MKTFLALVILSLVPVSAFSDIKSVYCDELVLGTTNLTNKVTNPRLTSCSSIDLEHLSAADYCLPESCTDRETCKHPRFKEFYSDPINLRPALACINRSRGSKPICEVPGTNTEYIGCGIQIDDCLEPPDHNKAEIALRIIYADLAYSDICKIPQRMLDDAYDWASDYQY